MFDEDKNPYTPVFTNKNGKQYRYYMNGYLNRDKNHPDKLRSRLPAHELEEIIEQALRQELLAEDKLSAALNLDHEEDRHAIAHIINNQEKLPVRNLIKALEHIIVTPDSLIIKVLSGTLSSIISEELELGLPVPAPDLVHDIAVPYQTRRARDGAIILEGKRNKNDPFDLPPNELKQLVQGIIWRDEHFRGMTV